MNAHLTPITAVHIDVMHGLHNACFETPWTKDIFQTTFESPLGLFGLMAYNQDTPCGFIWGRCLYEELEILTLCVHPNYQGQRLGKQLLNEMLHMFPTAKVFLEVAVDNHPALHVYKSLGFIETGKRKNYYTRPDNATVDASVMTLDRKILS